MIVLKFDFAYVYRQKGSVVITETTSLEPEQETLVDVHIEIDDSGIAHIQATRKKTTYFWEPVQFYGKNRKEKFIKYCIKNGIEPTAALKKVHERKGWFRKSLWLGYDYYFTGKEEPVYFYTSNYIINL